MPCAPADFRPRGLFSVFGTEVSLLVPLLTSVPEACFLLLGRKSILVITYYFGKFVLYCFVLFLIFWIISKIVLFLLDSVRFTFDLFFIFHYYSYMNISLIHEAKEILEDLKNTKHRMDRQLASLDSYGSWKLKRNSAKQSKHCYYDVILPDSKKRKYLGNESNEAVLNIKRYRYAQKAVEIIESDIEVLERLIRNYVSPDYSNINSRLPVTYQTDLTADNSEEAFRTALPPEAIRWINDLKQEKEKFPPYKPEQLRFEALDGTKMRSLGEVIIANFLLMAGIPFVYEVPMKINGELVLPDFRILSLLDLKTVIIIEHQGMIFTEEYPFKYIRSLRLYLQSDLVINKDLFFTFTDEKGKFDIRQLTGIIRQYIKPSIDTEMAGYLHDLSVHEHPAAEVSDSGSNFFLRN